MGKIIAFRDQTKEAVIGAAEHWRDNQRAGERVPLERHAVPREPDMLKVYNDTEEDWEKYDVVELTTPRIDPTSGDGEHEWANSWPVMSGEEPGEEPRGRIAIVIEPIAKGETGWAVVSGLVQTVVHQNDEDHRYAEAVEGSRRLETTFDAGAPCEILWMGEADEETDEAFAIVRVGNNRRLLYEFCLQEDHPGRGIVFDVKLGTWNPESHSWCFEGNPVKAIDWRFDVPYPDAGARGQGYFLPSTEHGCILIPIDMDCSSPGACPECGGS